MLTNRPPAGWTERADGALTFTDHDKWARPPAAPDGYTNRWIARHTDWVTWIYRPTPQEAP